MATPSNPLPSNQVGFAKKDLTDGRRPYDWKAKYDNDATKLIKQEAIYVGSVLLLSSFLLGFVWCRRNASAPCWIDAFGPPIGSDGHRTLIRYIFAWLGGMIGGVLFTIKWLYHSVAKGGWHIERRLWRVFTPLISGALACMVVVLIASGIFPVLNARSVDSLKGTLGVAFLAGYFSDHAIAKLTEIAETLFGRRMDAGASNGEQGQPDLSSTNPPNPSSKHNPPS